MSVWTPNGSEMTSRQSWKLEKKVRFPHVPYFKGLLRGASSSRVWQDFYLVSRPPEKKPFYTIKGLVYGFPFPSKCHCVTVYKETFHTFTSLNQTDRQIVDYMWLNRIQNIHLLTVRSKAVLFSKLKKARSLEVQAARQCRRRFLNTVPHCHHITVDDFLFKLLKIEFGPEDVTLRGLSQGC